MVIDLKISGCYTVCVKRRYAMNSAIIGLGVIGKVHYDTLKKQGERIVALCDIDKSKLAEFCADRKYDDYKKMLDDGGIDVVHICTPHYLHADMTIYALEKGINVLCEKPLCIRKEDIARIEKAEKESKAIFGVCFQNRFNLSSVFAKDYLKDKHIDYAFGSMLWHRDAAYYATAQWRGKKATEGGGVCINQAIHTLDLLEWLCGMPKSVIANVSNRSLQGVIEVEDTASATFKGDTNFEFFATNTASADLPVKIEIAFDKHVLTILPDKVLLDGKIIDFESDVKWQGKLSYGNGHEKLIRKFYDCVKSGEKFPIDASEGAKSLRAVLAVYESNGKEVLL